MTDIPPFRYDFNIADRICTVIVYGEINYKGSVNAMRYVAEHPDFNSDFKIIVDARLMSYHPSYEDLLGMINTVKFLKGSFKNKIALVTENKMEVIAKLMAVYCELAGMKIKSFVDIEKANMWINEHV